MIQLGHLCKSFYSYSSSCPLNTTVSPLSLFPLHRNLPRLQFAKIFNPFDLFSDCSLNCNSVFLLRLISHHFGLSDCNWLFYNLRRLLQISVFSEFIFALQKSLPLLSPLRPNIFQSFFIVFFHPFFYRFSPLKLVTWLDSSFCCLDYRLKAHLGYKKNNLLAAKIYQQISFF